MLQKALVTGVTGQVGSYAAELLLSAGCEVYGVRGANHGALPRTLTELGVRDAGRLSAEGAATLVAETHPDVVLHFAGASRVSSSFDSPLSIFDVNVRLTIALAEASVETDVTFVNASSAEIFAGADTTVQDERTPLAPRSPYGASKAAAHLYVAMLRDGRAALASNVIFYPGESERRPPDFAFAKLTRGLAAVARGQCELVTMGNLSAVRDFLHARDLAAAAIRIASAPPGDYVCASGEGHSVAEVADVACSHLGLDRSRVLRTDASLLRPTDARSLIGDARRLRALGWAPSMDFRTLVHTLVDHHHRALGERADCPKE